MKKSLTFLLLTLLSLSASADVFTVDGLRYYINSDTTSVTVTYQQHSYDYSWPSYPNLRGVLTIPPSIPYSGQTYSVTFISAYAFENCSGLTSVNIPYTIKAIGDCAFEGCSGLTGSLTIPDSVKSIGDGVFEGCSGLTSQHLQLPHIHRLRCFQ